MRRQMIVLCASAGFALAVLPAAPANAEPSCVGQGARNSRDRASGSWSAASLARASLVNL